MSTSMQTNSIIKLKRTRIRGPQSKSGCFTCKARRIKCDEEKPACTRCFRSARFCEGYPERVNQNTTLVVSTVREYAADINLSPSPLDSNPEWPIGIGWNQSQRQHRLAKLGIGLLSFDAFGSFGASGVVLDTFLPQLCYSISSVNAAATALGAVHEMQASCTFSSPPDVQFAASQYRAALRAMHRDLLKQPHGPIPLIMTCFILGIIEVFLQQESNALFHLRGAFKLLQDRKNTKVASSSAKRDILDTDFCSNEDDIEILFRTIDLQTCSYALSKTTDLPAISIPFTLSSMTDLKSAHISLIQLVHACYNFTSIAYKLKYRPLSASPSMCTQQSRYITQLSTWLEQFNHVILRTIPPENVGPSHDKIYLHALTLRMTALSALIHLSCILCPYETAYDVHALHFQQIITDGEAILSARHKELDPSIKGIDGKRFTTGPGPVQPLFFTAWKYRHPFHRRRAIALLSLAGREGPWSGSREARVTSRIMELEETSCSGLSSVLPVGVVSTRGEKNTRTGGSILSFEAAPRSDEGGFDSTLHIPDDPRTAHAFGRAWYSLKPQEERAKIANITESARIKTMGMESENANDRPSNRVIVRLWWCRDIERMLSCSCGHGPDQDWNLDTHSKDLCADGPHWEKWEQVLDF